MQYVNYFFLRLHFITASGTDDKLNFIRQGLGSDALIKQNDRV